MRNRVAIRVAAAAIAVVAAAAPGMASSQDLYVAGPLELVDAARMRLVVLGQDVAVSREQLARVLMAQRNAAGSQVQLIASGPASSAGIAAKRLLVQDGAYVSGASPVALLGFVTKVESSIGRVTIGRLPVDLNAVGHGIGLGTLVELGGIQPSERGVLVATELRLGTAGSIGTGTAGSIGTGSL